MTPQEKAKELVEWVMHYGASKEFAKLFALQVVKEIDHALTEYDNRNNTYELQNMDGDFRWWDIVKQEIEKL
jgi:hypothetical protein